jgi:REP element-mobilizing transposase RayT
VVSWQCIVGYLEAHDGLTTKRLSHPHLAHDLSTQRRPVRFLSSKKPLQRSTDDLPVPRRSPALLLVHVVWATARRQRLLQPAFDDTLIGIVGAKARDLGCTLIAGGCGPDHVHTVLRLSASVALADLVHRMKGGSAYDVNHPIAAPQSLRWQAGYWAESLGPADLDSLVRYVRGQRVHHDNSHPAESWQFGETW